jgi:quercetin dioxygenase-like cupin family protein
MREGRVFMLTLIAVALVAIAQGAVAARATLPAPVIENERVTVRKLVFQPGQGAEGDRGENSVIVYMTPAALRTPQGTINRKPGEAVYRQRGPRVREEVVGAPVGAMVVSLHDVSVTPIVNTSGYPEAFPRPGAIKVFENDRVVLWDYTFTPGQPSPMHFHSRDTVVLYTDDGAVTSTTPEGVSTVNEHPAGQVTFNRGNRAHTEVLSRGSVHIIVTELK